MTEACVNVDIPVGLLQQLENKPSGVLLMVSHAVKNGSEVCVASLRCREVSSQHHSLLGDAVAFWETQ